VVAAAQQLPVLLQLDLTDDAAIAALPARLRRELSVEAVHCLVNNA
jgi:NAD(P)-dependent dehydrogenase (short-subunit alcohol dehydrogenase family)